MHLLLLGATGRTGGHVLDLALSHGHEVTAFARSPGKLEPRPALRVVGGDPRTGEGLEAALEGCDAVVSTLGAPAREALRPSTLMTQFGAAVVRGMHAARVSRLAVLSAAVLFPGRGLTFSFFKWLLSHHARDLVGMEGLVRESELDWTITRPPRLVQANDTIYRAESDHLPSGGFAVSFRAVAAFMLESIERGAYVRQIVGVAR
jgi:putative NADH-flavin reductase